jgi:uncharacterized protein YjbI with pentapeptide repeats
MTSENKKSAPSQAPKLPAALPSLVLQNERLEDDEEYAEARLAGVVLAGQSAANLRLRQLLCKGVSFNQTRLLAPRLIDVRFEDCDLANANWERASAHRVEWVRCQLVGFTAAEAHWQDVTLRHCNANLALFRFAMLREPRFLECDFTDADFQGADLTGAVFAKCNLTNVEFSHAKLSGVDLRTATLEGVKAGASELKGAIVTPMQAAYLASRLGLVIKHIDEG